MLSEEIALKNNHYYYYYNIIELHGLVIYHCLHIHFLHGLCFVYFVSSHISSLFLMVQRNPPQAVWNHLVLSRCTMVSEVKSRGVQETKNIDYAKQHHNPHCWLPAKVMYPAQSTMRFSWLTRSTSVLLMKNVQIFLLFIIHFFAILPYVVHYVNL